VSVVEEIRRIRMCGFGTARLLSSINSIDSALEDIYKYSVIGDKEMVDKSIELAESTIESTISNSKLFERTCLISPEARKEFDVYIDMVKRALEKIKHDPKKAGEYRLFTRILLFGTAEKMLTKEFYA
jgi:hypothetical protein